MVLGEEGADRVFGGKAQDDVRGGPGEDRIEGDAGSDSCLSAMDGRRDDFVEGGTWFDTGDRDLGDHLSSVERITPNVCFGG